MRRGEGCNIDPVILEFTYFTSCQNFIVVSDKVGERNERWKYSGKSVSRHIERHHALLINQTSIPLS